MNPEFQRNLYLEFSSARQLGMPIFLLLVFSLSYLFDDKSFGEATANTAIGLYIVIVLFWGAKQSSESIFDEMRNNTWDIQKTSAISPWSLCWGKLFGSTVFNWYGGVLCLLVYTLAATDPELIALTWLYSLTAGLLAQSLSLLLSLLSLRRKQTFNSGFIYLFALFILLSIMPLILNIDEQYSQLTIWYEQQYNQSYFIACSLMIACSWSIIGVYRLLADELKVRTLPWVWVIFSAFLTLYITGFIDSENSEWPLSITMKLLFVGFFVSSILSYLLAFCDENNPMLLRKVWLYSSQGLCLRVAQTSPCWLISLLLAFPSMLVLSLLYPASAVDDFNFYPLVIYLLMLRDIAILLFFSYATNPKRAISLTVLYMISLYALLPAIFNAMEGKAMAGIIFPVLNSNPLWATCFASIQTVIIGYLLFQRWNKRVLG